MKYCEEYAVLLDAFADGECTPQEARQVREHLKTCESCRASLAEIQQMKAAFPDVEDTVVPDGFAEGVMAKVRAHPVSRRKAGKRWLKILVPLAACFAIVVAVREIFMGGTAAGETAALTAESAGASDSGTAENGLTAESPASETDESAAADQAAVGEAKNVPSPGSAGLTSKSSPTPTADAPASGAAASTTSPDTAAPGASVPEAETSHADNSVGDEAPQGLAALTAGNQASQEPWASDVSPIFRNQPLTCSDSDGLTYSEKLAALDEECTHPDYSLGMGFYAETHTEDGENIAWLGEWYGTPHEGQYNLYLRFADGTSTALPLPWAYALASEPPSSMWFEDGKFIYEMTFSEYSYLGAGSYHVAGTYRYTVDLDARTISLEIN